MTDTPKPPMVVCSDPSCQQEGVNKWSASASYCDKHYRFRSMRHRAKANGKAIPSPVQLESYLMEAHGLICPQCGRQMVWRVKKGESISHAVSLQHWKDGTMSFICFGCNSSQARLAKPNEREKIPNNHKRCSKCLEVLPKSHFNKHSRKRSGVRSQCRKCELAKEIKEQK